MCHNLPLKMKHYGATEMLRPTNLIAPTGTCLFRKIDIIILIFFSSENEVQKLHFKNVKNNYIVIPFSMSVSLSIEAFLGLYFPS